MRNEVSSIYLSQSQYEYSAEPSGFKNLDDSCYYGVKLHKFLLIKNEMTFW